MYSSMNSLIATLTHERGQVAVPEQILIIEDEPDIVETIRYHLEKTGFDVLSSGDAETALDILNQSNPDLILLDLILPGMNGFDFCKEVKREPRTRAIPICVLSARRHEVDRVLAFELGVDDYIVKPFSLRELTLRIRGILQRVTQVKQQKDDRLAYGILSLDSAAHKVTVENETKNLTPIEFQLLFTLMERAGRVQSRRDLLNAVWGYNHLGNGRMVDAHIRRMRAKLGTAQEMIRTVRGVGYCFKPIE